MPSIVLFHVQIAMVRGGLPLVGTGFRLRLFRRKLISLVSFFLSFDFSNERH